MQLLFKIDEISTNFPCRISTSNRWRIDEDVSIGMRKVKGTKGKVEPSKQFPQRGKTNISEKNSSLVVKHSILKGLIINLDQTPLSCVTPSKYTFDVLSTKTVPVKGLMTKARLPLYFLSQCEGVKDHKRITREEDHKRII